MVYESSYDSGRKPFQPNLARGYWAAPSDFIYAGLGLALRLDVLATTWLFMSSVGIYAIIPYMLCLGLYVVPLVVIQSFMGQFSSSGFISTFRLSPIFKSMGYLSLAVNITTLIYYSLFATIPLLYLFHSFRPTLPWSCEAIDDWVNDYQVFEGRTHICNKTTLEFEGNSNSTQSNSSIYFDSVMYEVPSVLFLSSRFGNINMLRTHDYVNLDISWELVICHVIVWTIVGGIFYLSLNTEKMGKLIRYGVWLTLGLLIVCLSRLLFPDVFPSLEEYVYPSMNAVYDGFSGLAVYGLPAFGVGWGVIISLSSFNKFRTNIMTYSWIICVGQMFIFIIFDLITHLMSRHLENAIPKYEDSDYFYTYVADHWILYLSSGSVLASLSWPNLWCIIYYSMLIVAALVVMVTQVYSVLTSILDEFVGLRSHKVPLTYGLIMFLALSSLYTCTTHGVLYFSALTIDSLLTQTALNLLLLLVVLWIYGRQRFQRDIEFMLGQPFATWKVNMLRFVSPLALILLLLFYIAVAIFEHAWSSIPITITAIIFIALPWFAVPIYAVVVMLQTTGTFKMRFLRSCRPSDWYPVEPEERQRYEEAMGNLDITHQLHEITEEVPSS